MNNEITIEKLKVVYLAAEREMMEANGLSMEALAYNSTQAVELWECLKKAHTALKVAGSNYAHAIECGGRK